MVSVLIEKSPTRLNKIEIELNSAQITLMLLLDSPFERVGEDGVNGKALLRLLDAQLGFFRVYLLLLCVASSVYYYV